MLPTRVSGTFAQLLTGRPMRFTACSPVTLAAGPNRVTEPAADAFDVQDVVLRSAGPPRAAGRAGRPGHRGRGAVVDIVAAGPDGGRAGARLTWW